MHPNIDVITLGVRDLERAKEFYAEGLGCPIQKDEGKFVSYALGDSSSALALYQWDALADDAGARADGNGFGAFTLSYIVDSPEQVDAVLARVAGTGAKTMKPARRALWGGYSGYVADPDGYLWKVASASAPPLVRRRHGSQDPERQLLPAQPKETIVTLGVEDMKQ